MRSLIKMYANCLNKNFIWNLGLPENCKKIWRYISSRLNSLAPTRFKFNGIYLDKPKEIAQAFSDCFQSNYTNCSSVSDICPPVNLPNVPPMNSFKCDVGIVEKLLSSVKPSASPGPDGIPGLILNKCSSSLSHSLACFFDYSLKISSVPASWKEANVTPVYKSGDRDDINNYRPISITSLVGKILEKIVVFNILEHLRTNNLINKNQHGFLPKRSCITMLVHILDEWVYNLAKKGAKQIDVLNLDWSKAFDKVPHKRLISKLWSYKIRGPALQWLSSFLSGRTQKVVYRGECSLPISVPSGVCQGSVIGPLLFAIFMLDLPNCVQSSVAQYADDSSLYNAVKDDNDVSMIQDDLQALSIWCINNEMTLNASKSSHIQIGFSHSPIDSQYHINNSVIPRVSSVKCLGIYISDDIKWTMHTDYVTAKAFKILGVLRRTLTGSRRVALRSAYLSLVRPIILYGLPAWNPVTVANLKKLERVQSVATSLILGRDSYEYVNGVKHKINSDKRNVLCKIPSISDLLYKHDVIFLHKCIMGEADLPVFLPERITVRSKPSHLRGGGTEHFTVPIATAAYYNDSFIPRSTSYYNKLSAAVRKLPLTEFKSAVT
jgi:Reverse transcriptase (RNA-dependent DNA polymerase)